MDKSGQIIYILYEINLANKEIDVIIFVLNLIQPPKQTFKQKFPTTNVVTNVLCVLN